MVLFTSFSDDNLDLNVLKDDIRYNDNNIDNYHAQAPSREKDLRFSDVAFESPFSPGFPGFKHSPEKCPNIDFTPILVDFYSHNINLYPQNVISDSNIIDFSSHNHFASIIFYPVTKSYPKVSLRRNRRGGLLADTAELVRFLSTF